MGPLIYIKEKGDQMSHTSMNRQLRGKYYVSDWEKVTF